MTVKGDAERYRSGSTPDNPGGKRRRQQRFSAAMIRTCPTLNVLSRALWNAFCGRVGLWTGRAVLQAPVPPLTDTRQTPGVNRGHIAIKPTRADASPVSRPGGKGE